MVGEQLRIFLKRAFKLIAMKLIRVWKSRREASHQIDIVSSVTVWDEINKKKKKIQVCEFK